MLFLIFHDPRYRHLHCCCCCCCCYSGDGGDGRRKEYTSWLVVAFSLALLYYYLVYFVVIITIVCDFWLWWLCFHYLFVQINYCLDILLGNRHFTGNRHVSAFLPDEWKQVVVVVPRKTKKNRYKVVLFVNRCYYHCNTSVDTCTIQLISTLKQSLYETLYLL